MMKFPLLPRLRTFAVVLLLAAGGCGQQQREIIPPSPPTPISLAEWKQLPIEEKYDGATLERLRMSNKKLKSDRAWNSFMAKEVIPERKKDIPGIPGQH